MSDETNGIETFIMRTLTEEFGIPGDDLSPAADLKSLGIDSLGGVELSLAIKKEYGVAFVAGEISVEFSLAEIAALVQKKRADDESPAS
jgi:acyl carrier protein